MRIHECELKGQPYVRNAVSSGHSILTELFILFNFFLLYQLMIGYIPTYKKAKTQREINQT